MGGLFKMKKEAKEYIIIGLCLIIGVGLGIGIGIMVIANVNYETGFIEGYCADREGIQNIKHLNLSFWEEDIINCTHCKRGCVTQAVSRTG